MSTPKEEPIFIRLAKAQLYAQQALQVTEDSRQIVRICLDASRKYDLPFKAFYMLESWALRTYLRED